MVIEIFFYIIFFFVPLVLYPYSSELFEFNKMLTVYAFTVLITAAWIFKMIRARKIIFRRTALDIPLVTFLIFQFVSFLVSIDPRTSLLGFYSRFHGGLMSSLSYSLLYWAYVSNVGKKNTQRILIFALLPSALLVSAYGILEHFGIDKDVWVQDVQNRVFSTLGQPNWLSAWLASIMPITWVLAKKEKASLKNLKFLIPFALSIVFFITLLFTKSRSGILGFVASSITFWVILGLTELKEKRASNFFTVFLFINLAFIIIVAGVGTPWTPSLPQLLRGNPTTSTVSAEVGPLLETGGTESGTIRKIVWRGAVDIWKHYPLFGTGAETFAFSYYRFRPVEHNLVSEWDYLYNKAHNEYLNMAANTGTFGLLSYLLLVVFSAYLILKSSRSANTSGEENSHSLGLALFAGYLSILVTNFFGFSVVPVALNFFLYPAFAVTLGEEKGDKIEAGPKQKFSAKQRVLTLSIFLVAVYMLFLIARYWYADLLYAQARILVDRKRFFEANGLLQKVVSYSPKEAIFRDELSQSATGIALTLPKPEDESQRRLFIDQAISESNLALSLSPANVNLVKNRSILLTKLSIFNKDYLNEARDVLILETRMAPTDAKLFFSLAQAYARLGDNENAMKVLVKTINLKPNYEQARFAYAILLIDKGETKTAREELRYILTNINPNNQVVKDTLKEIGP